MHKQRNLRNESTISRLLNNMPKNELDNFFNPKSVAIIGASGNREKIGYGILKNLIEGGYKGKILPVNLRSKKILGIKAYPSVSYIKDKVDLAIIVVPAQFVNGVLEECGKKGVKNAIVVSAGFKETGKAGAKLENDLCKLADKFSMKIIGPNCLGLADSTSCLNASFANGMIQKGTLGFISQSGAICSAMLDWANLNGVGFSRFISIGNKAVVSEVELLEYFKDDDNTSAVLAYLENIEDGKAFMRATAQLAKVKPLVIIKPGVSKASQQAMQSHTGALTGADESVRVAFSQSGAVRVKTIEELFDVAKFLSRYRRLKGNRVAIITNAGGPGVIGTDEIEECGLTLAALSKKTRELLKDNLPTEANIHNPIDVLGDAKEDRFRVALRVLADDKNVDAIAFILTPQRGTEVAKTAKALASEVAKIEKPIVASFIGGKLIEKEAGSLKKSRMAYYNQLSGAIFAMGKAWECEKNIEEAKEYLGSCRMSVVENKSAGKPEAFSASPDFMQAMEILKEYKIPVVRSEVAYTAEEAAHIAGLIGYPVAMKIFSKNISHKTEADGVKIGIGSDLEAREYFDRMEKELGGDLEGMVVQPMVKGREIILGLKKEGSFGHMLMFGLGGVYTEAVKDVAFRFAPIDRNEALEMMREIKTFKTLTGYREFPKMDIESVVDALVGLSRLATVHPEIREMDINPLIVQKEGEGCKAVDARIII